MTTKTKQAFQKVKNHTVTPIIDLILGRTMSKKLMVFFIATVFVGLKYISSVDWIEIAKIYIGSQAVVDVAGTFVGKYRKDNESKPPNIEDNE